MADDQQFCLRWNDFQANMVASFKHLRDEKSFCDVTIATEVFETMFFYADVSVLLGSAYQGTQDDPLCMLAILQEPSGAEPRQASHYHPEGRPLCPPHSHLGVHVCWGGERGTGATSCFPQDCRETQDQGACRRHSG